MVNRSGDYIPPTSGAVLQERQNETEALRLLITQKRLYSKAKLWLNLRWFGMLLSGVISPIVAAIWPQISVFVGGAAGIWLFLSRTLLLYLQENRTMQAAALQERFDFQVYEMPSNTPRSGALTLEEIHKVAGDNNAVRKTAQEEKLLNWYTVPQDVPGTLAVAIAQRSNASYSYMLLKTTVFVWLVIAVVWGIIIVTISLIIGLSLASFILGVLFPLLPALLDVSEHILSLNRSTKDREALYSDIESKIDQDSQSISGENLRVWQETLYELRRSTPTVPDLLYKLRRQKNEEAIASASEHLGKRQR